jgi:hypothetical protein
MVLFRPFALRPLPGTSFRYEERRDLPLQLKDRSTIHLHTSPNLFG